MSQYVGCINRPAEPALYKADDSQSEERVKKSCTMIAVIKKYTKCERYDLTIVNAMNSFNLHRLLEMRCYSNFYSIY